MKNLLRFIKIVLLNSEKEFNRENLEIMWDMATDNIPDYPDNI